MQESDSPARSCGLKHRGAHHGLAVSIWDSLVQSALGGLIVLAVGGLAVRLCRQPVDAARLVVLTILGGLLVPWLGCRLPLPIRLPGCCAVVDIGAFPGIEMSRSQGPDQRLLRWICSADLRHRGNRFRIARRPARCNPVGTIAAPTRTNAWRRRWASTALSTLADVPWQQRVHPRCMPSTIGRIAGLVGPRARRYSGGSRAERGRRAVGARPLPRHQRAGR